MRDDEVHSKGCVLAEGKMFVSRTVGMSSSELS